MTQLDPLRITHRRARRTPLRWRDYQSLVLNARAQQTPQFGMVSSQGGAAAAAPTTANPEYLWVTAGETTVPPYSVFVTSTGVSSPSPDERPIMQVQSFQPESGSAALGLLLTADERQVIPTYAPARVITPWDWCRLRVKQADSSSTDDATDLVPGRWCGPTNCTADTNSAAAFTISKNGFGLVVMGDAGDWEDADETVWHTRWCTAYLGIVWYWCQLKTKVADGHWTVQLLADDGSSNISEASSSLAIVDAYCPVVGSNNYPLDGSTYAVATENRRAGRWDLSNFTQCGS